MEESGTASRGNGVTEEGTDDRHTPGTASSREVTDSDANFLSLPAFRMMCLSNPLLDTFFSSQLPASFRLEVPHKASINGTSIWHDITSSETQMSASSSMSSSIDKNSRATSKGTTSAPATVTSFPMNGTSARAYSKDISTGVVGRLGGFLNTFLGEEVKAKVDDLADSLGERLNTKQIRGPLPSFTILNDQHGSTSKSSSGLGRKQSSGTLGMDDLRALEEQRREKRRIREEEERQEEAIAAEGMAGVGTINSQLRGIDINAAQESLRMATEAVVEGTQTGGKQFGDDATVIADTHGGEEDYEEEDVIVDDDVVHLNAR
ncbi:hypothetical protein CBS101457_003375 [Exobasidium rhododendri]|nr:hypothetical protein CBS101457_003375 [Exobasidium rhododendri]